MLTNKEWIREKQHELDDWQEALNKTRAVIEAAEPAASSSCGCGRDRSITKHNQLMDELATQEQTEEDEVGLSLSRTITLPESWENNDSIPGHLNKHHQRLNRLISWKG